MIKRRKAISLLLMITLVVAAIFSMNLPIGFWNFLFLVGIVLFLCGGGIIILKKGVFHFFYYSFKIFMQRTSKLEEYVSEKEQKAVKQFTNSNNNKVYYYLFLCGVLFMLTSTIYSYYLY